VEAKLKQLEEQDIMEHVTGPTPWVSLVVIVDKPNGKKAERNSPLYSSPLPNISGNSPRP